MDLIFNSGTLSKVISFSRSFFAFFLIFICSLLAVLPGFFYSGGPTGWDDLLYLSLSVKPEKEAWVLGRYFHIYFQKLFVEMFDNPIRGSQGYWLFCVWGTLFFSGSTALVLFRRQLVPAILVIFLIISVPLVSTDYFAVSHVDFTLMLLSSVLAFVSSTSIFLPHNARLFKILMSISGLLFFLMMKTKESGLPFALLVFAPILITKASLKHTFYVLTGLVVGMVIIMILDFLFLNDLFFSFRFTSVTDLVRFNFGQPTYPKLTYSWWGYLFSSTMAPIFVLYLFYLFSGAFRNLKSDSERFLKFLAVMPLGAILFFVTTSLIGAWGVITRYLLPFLPSLCIVVVSLLATQLRLEHRRQAIRTFSMLGLFIIVCLAIYWVLLLPAKRYSWSESIYFSSFYIQMVVGLIISMLYVGLNTRIVALMLTAILISTGALSLSLSAGSIIAERSFKKFGRRAYPFEVWKSYLKVSDNSKIFISEKLHTELTLAGRDLNSNHWLIKILLYSGFKKENLNFGSIDKIDLPVFEYIFATNVEVEALPRRIKENFRFIEDPRGIISLGLLKKPNM